jgi:hypothetical protein
MADTKISALPASTTPLAGTEVLPIVQSSSTKQVSVANLTTGRDVATAALSATGIILTSDATDSSSTITGSLKTAGGLGVAKIATVNVLREITGEAWTAYTPTLAVDTGTITTSIQNARYRQLGKTLFISLSITFTVTSGSPTEFRVTFPGGQVAPNNNQYTPVYMNFNSTAILGLARATVNAYGLQITPSNGLTYTGVCGFFVNTVFELN